MSENIPVQELINLGGKCAIVTGGASGIGLAISHRLAEAGAIVIIVDINENEARNACVELNSLGYRTEFIRCDVASEDEVKQMVADAVKITGGIDILVNNAGIYPRKPLQEMTGEDFGKVISINLLGMFLCSRYVAVEMIKVQRGGSIINMASIEAVHPTSAGMTAYGASKGGALMLTKSLARELGAHEIRVNAIAPGGIKTKGVLSRTTTQENTGGLKELKSFLSRIALDRLGDADEIARVALFLASELSSYITGDLIVVDGGYLVS
jgi:NAD(P)-dependent dehydrogenase (short-subunit alcohol dehydrogenase family)